MACVNPNYAARTYSGNIKFLGPRHISLYDDPNWLFKNGYREILQIPCLKCQQCRLHRSREWAVRCMLEAKKYEHNEVLTLTYDDKHLPMVDGVDTNTGEKTKVPTLRKRDFQLFMKRLRKAFFDVKIRDFGCGEYGEKRGRPHYHIIVYNLFVPDKRPFGVNERGNEQETSEIIRKIWGKGIVSLMPVNFETCAYVARYIFKKQLGSGSSEFYNLSCQEPEFLLMSRRPGIGRDFYDANKEDIYKTDNFFVKTKNGVEKVKPSRYFDKLYDLDNPEAMLDVKERRKVISDIVCGQRKIATDLDVNEYNDVLFSKKLEQLKKLPRNFEKRGY